MQPRRVCRIGWWFWRCGWSNLGVDIWSNSRERHLGNRRASGEMRCQKSLLSRYSRHRSPVWLQHKPNCPGVATASASDRETSLWQDCLLPFDLRRSTPPPSIIPDLDSAFALVADNGNASSEE